MKHPLIAPMIFLLSIESFATEARFEKDLEVLNGNNFAAISNSAGETKRIPGFIENADAFKLCRAIRLSTKVGSISGLVSLYAERRKMTVPHFINNVLAKQNCGGETDRYNIVTFAMMEEWISFQTLVNDGLDVNKKLRDTDDLMRTPIEIATLNMKNGKAEDDLEKRKHWRRIKVIAYRRSKELLEKTGK